MALIAEPRGHLAGWRTIAGCFAAILLVCDAQAQPAEPAADVQISAAKNATAPKPPPLQILAAIDFSETYTSNAGGNTGFGLSAGDAYTRARLNLGVRYNMGPVNLQANYALIADKYAQFSQLDNYTNRLNLAADATLIPEQLVVQGSAFAAPALLNRVGAISAGGEPISNIDNRDSYGYVVEPRYFLRIGDYASSTTSVSKGDIFFVSPSTSNLGVPTLIPPVQDSASFSVREQIKSGTYFSQIQWDLTLSRSEMTQVSNTQTQEDGVADISYQLNRHAALLASGGYSAFRSSSTLSRDLSGPAALGGFKFSYGPTFTLTAQAGERNRYPTYIGSLLWAITAMTKVTGSLTDAIGTPQNDILANLSNLAAGIDTAAPNYAAPTSPTAEQALAPQLSTVSPISSQGLALDNSINRERRTTISLLHESVRTQYSLTLVKDTRDRLDLAGTLFNPHTSLYSVNAMITRKMRTNLTSYVSASYSLAHEFGGEDRILGAEAGVSYTMSDTLSLYLTNRYLHRDLNGVIGVPNAPLDDDEVVLGIRKAF